MYSRGSTVYEKNRDNFDWGYEMVGRAKNVKNFHFQIDFWKLLNQSFSIFFESWLSDLKPPYTHFAYSPSGGDYEDV